MLFTIFNDPTKDMYRGRWKEVQRTLDNRYGEVPLSYLRGIYTDALRESDFVTAFKAWLEKILIDCKDKRLEGKEAFDFVEEALKKERDEIIDLYNLFLRILYRYFFIKDFFDSENAISAVKLKPALIAALEKPFLEIRSETTVTPVGTKLGIAYRNIRRVYVQALKGDLIFSLLNPRPKTHEDKLKELLQAEYCNNWIYELPEAKPHEDKVVYVDLPELPEGFYYLLFSLKEDFDATENILGMLPVNISNLRLSHVMLESEEKKVFAMDAQTGKPLKGVKIHLFFFSDKQKSQVPFHVNSYVTNKDGYAVIVDKFPYLRQKFLLVGENKKSRDFVHAFYRRSVHENTFYQRLSSSVHSERTEKSWKVHFKACCFSMDKETNVYEVMKAEPVQVTLLRRGKVIADQELLTDDSGELSGFFEICKDDELAKYQAGKYKVYLQSLKDETLRASHSVILEKYPETSEPEAEREVQIDTDVSFYLRLETEKKQVCLYKPVEIRGRLFDSSDSPIGETGLSYEVEREAIIPFQRWDLGWKTTEKIDESSAYADDEGCFKFNFTPIPDKRIPKELFPVFKYTIKTNVTGENDYACIDTISVYSGYSSVLPETNFPELLEAGKNLKFTAAKKELSGKAVPGKVKIKIFELMPPMEPPKLAILELEDLELYSGMPKLPDYFTPHTSLRTKSCEVATFSDMRFWDNGKLIKEIELDLSENPAEFTLKLPEGAYRLVAETFDENACKAGFVKEFEAIDINSVACSLVWPFEYRDWQLPKRAGDLYQGYWASSSKNARAHITVAHRNKVLDAFWTKPRKNKHWVSFPVTEEMRGGFYILVMQTYKGHRYFKKHYVPFDWEEKDFPEYFFCDREEHFYYDYLDLIEAFQSIRGAFIRNTLKVPSSADDEKAVTEFRYELFERLYEIKRRKRKVAGDFADFANREINSYVASTSYFWRVEIPSLYYMGCSASPPEETLRAFEAYWRKKEQKLIAESESDYETFAVREFFSERLFAKTLELREIKAKILERLENFKCSLETDAEFIDSIKNIKGNTANELLNRAEKLFKKQEYKLFCRDSNKVYEEALDVSDFATAFKVTFEKILAERKINNPKGKDALSFIEARLKTEVSEIKIINEALLCVLYRCFYLGDISYTDYLDNRSIQRSSSPSEISEVAEKLEELYEKVLSSEKYLRSIPLSKLAGIIDLGDVSEQLVPNCFEYMLHEALRFYEPAEPFSMTLHAVREEHFIAHLLSATEDFLFWDPAKHTSNPRLCKAVNIYQKLFECNLAEKNHLALSENRLRLYGFARKCSYSMERCFKYLKDWLEKFIKEEKKQEYKARGYLLLAKLWQEKSDNALAYECLTRAKEISNDENLYNLAINKQSWLTEPYLHINCESSALPKGAEFEISYRNISRIYFRAVKSDFENYMQEELNEDLYISDLLKEEPYKSWHTELTSEPAYEEKTEYISSPEFEEGFYYLFYSLKENFQKADNLLGCIRINISEVFMQGMTFESKISQILVADAVSGNPLQGAKVCLFPYPRDYEPISKEPIISLLTDETGLVTISEDLSKYVQTRIFATAEYSKSIAFLSDFPPISSRNWLAEFRLCSQHGKPEVRWSSYFIANNIKTADSRKFYFKAVYCHLDQIANTYKAIASKPAKATLKLPLSQTLGEHKSETNAFGSVSGLFELPFEPAFGLYDIDLEILENEAKDFHGNDLKISQSQRLFIKERARFYIELETDKEQASFFETVRISGRTVAFSGLPASDEKLTYSVFRRLRKCLWSGDKPDISSHDLIARNVLCTDKEGRFSFEFITEPCEEISAEFFPVCEYFVEVYPEDKNSFNPSGSLSVYSAASAVVIEVDFPEKLEVGKDLVFSTYLSDLLGKPLSGPVNIQLFDLIPPLKLPRLALNEEMDFGRYYKLPHRPDYFFSDSELIPESCGSEEYYDIRFWKNGNLIKEIELNLIEEPQEFSLNLPEGAYRLVAQAFDDSGNETALVREFEAVYIDSDLYSLFYPLEYKDIKLPQNLGDLYQGFWGSCYKDARAYIAIVHRNKLLDAFWTEPGKNKHVVSFPVTEEMRGGFHILIMQVRDNDVLLKKHEVSFPWTNKVLDIKMKEGSLRPKPGEKCKYCFEVKDLEGKNVKAEVTALLYDSSAESYEVSLPDCYDFYSPFLDLREKQSIDAAQKYSDNRLETLEEPYESRLMPSLQSEIIDFIAYRSAKNELKSDWFENFMNLKLEYFSSDSFKVEKRRGTDIAKEADICRIKELSSLQDRLRKPTGTEKLPLPRELLNETLLFEPELLTDEEGKVCIEFEMPELPVTLNLHIIAHTEDLKIGELKAVVSSVL